MHSSIQIQFIVFIVLCICLWGLYMATAIAMFRETGRQQRILEKQLKAERKKWKDIR